MNDLVFHAYRAEEGGYWAEAEGVSITTQGEDLPDLVEMINDAVKGYFFDDPASIPKRVTLYLNNELHPGSSSV